jgi:micrococcal nuclease
VIPIRAGLPMLAALTALVVLAGCAEEEQTAAVARVVDGDTIELQSGREVRLLQVDAPEGAQGECYADEATAVLRRLLPEGGRVRLEADPRLDRVDQYGRLLRYIFTGETNVNLLLVGRGAATVWFYEGVRGRYAEQLLRAAREGRAAKRGLWGACPRTPFDPSGPADTG